AAYLLEQQEPHGGWAMFPGGTIEISGSVKAYLALKITGHDPDADYMVRAREAILKAGGVERVNSFTRYYLAMLGLIPYSACPAVPPEMILIPKWAPLNIYEMSAWSRTIVVPLSLLWAFQPQTTLRPEHRIDELFTSANKQMPVQLGGVNHEGSNRSWINWTRFFQRVDGTIKLCERLGIKPFRNKAIQRCEQWILDRLEMSDGLGAIFPPIVWTIIGLKSLGYRDDSPVIVQQKKELEKLVIRENEQVRLQPCFSPVWDTIISIIALREAGVSRHDPVIRRAINWVLSKEVRHPGDWSLSHPTVKPGGWYFEYKNEFYPDVDDTCMTLIALGKCLPDGMGTDWKMEFLDVPQNADSASLTDLSMVALSGRSATAEKALAEVGTIAPMIQAMHRGWQWLKAMQSRDGGWG
ncbi:MAG: squalene--hopene cyclase, partial [Planctomycetes bacterium]|nr:squalene--hopene cyclase [Planctomycetota bacterium]